MQLFDMDNYPKLKHFNAINAINLTPEFIARFEAKVIRDDCMPGGCHIWTGPLSSKKYGTTNLNGKNVRAHRVSYTIYNGEIGHGLIVCHRCDNPPCVNPAHLFLGTYTDNEQDKLNKGRNYQKNKTHCKHGHPYSGENLRFRSNGHRECFTCRQISNRQTHERLNKKPKQIKTMCKNGHPWIFENLYTRPNGQIECQTCRKMFRYKT